MIVEIRSGGNHSNIANATCATDGWYAAEVSRGLHIFVLNHNNRISFRYITIKMHLHYNTPSAIADVVHSAASSAY